MRYETLFAFKVCSYKGIVNINFTLFPISRHFHALHLLNIIDDDDASDVHVRFAFPAERILNYHPTLKWIKFHLSFPYPSTISFASVRLRDCLRSHISYHNRRRPSLDGGSNLSETDSSSV